ncbi:MAG TPA: hypothetical protein DIC42_02570, partial [Holosporales bacterium]|nr:hypothetical protein [Holosporales bacterium]
TYFFMFVSSHCSAASYNLDALMQNLHKKNITFNLFEDVLHIDFGAQSDVFVFSYGCYVIWNSTKTLEDKTFSLCQEVASGTLNAFVRDQCKVQYSDNTKIHHEDDLIELESQDVYIRFSFSHGLAQSVKLKTFEQSVLKTINETRFLPEQIKKHGKTTLSRRKLSQLIGALFQERNSINLDCDLLDAPDFFWRRPNYEPYYLMSATYMDLHNRLEVLNKRLDTVHELHNFLSSELNHSHSSFLEWIIIILILVEVVLTVAKDILKLI